MISSSEPSNENLDNMMKFRSMDESTNKLMSMIAIIELQYHFCKNFSGYSESISLFINQSNQKRNMGV